MDPVIGITPSPTRDTLPHGTFERYVLSANYANAILAAGGIPLILPPQDGHTVRIIEVVDGLLFSGGADLDPALYGDPDLHPETYGVHPLRDRFEIDLLRLAVARDMPFLCICRGIQVMNVALGGTLIQDIPAQYGQDVEHRQHEAGLKADEFGHRLTVTPGSVLERVFGAPEVGVNSFHHQAIKDLAPGATVVGRSEDGLIEAIALPDRACAIGVQWHPELMFERHPEHLRPFAHLVEAARTRKLAGTLS